MQNRKIYPPGLAVRLARACGMSESGVYRCLRTGRSPRNELVREVWDRILVEFGVIE